MTMPDIFHWTVLLAVLAVVQLPFSIIGLLLMVDEIRELWWLQVPTRSSR